MRIENLVGAPKPEKVWSDGVLEFYIHQASDGEVWVHHKLIQPMTKAKYAQAPFSMMDFFEQLKSAIGVDKIYTVATKGKQVDWAVYGGWEPLYDALVDGVESTVLEYAE